MTSQSVTLGVTGRDYADLLKQVQELLQNHPAGKSFNLLVAPEGLTLEPGEVLVQRVDPTKRVVTLMPVLVTDLTPQDLIHATQVLPTDDPALTGYALTVTHRDYTYVEGQHQ